MHAIRKLAGCLSLFFCVSLSEGQQKQAYLNVSRVTASAVDALGVRHKAEDYPAQHGSLCSWLACVSVPIIPQSTLSISATIVL